MLVILTCCKFLKDPNAKKVKILYAMLFNTTCPYLANQSHSLFRLIASGFATQTISKHVNGKDKVVSSVETGNFRLSFHFEHLTLVLAALIVFRLSQKKFCRQKSWVESLPGPRTFPIVGGLLHLSGDLRQTFKLLLNWSKQFGPIFRIEGVFNEPYILLNNPDHVQAVLSSNQLGLVSKPEIPYNTILGQFLKNGLLVSSGEYWKSHRRTLSRAFTYKSFYGYAEIFNQYSKQLVVNLKERFPDKENLEPKQISDLIHCCSLQIICVSVLGLDFCDSKESVLFYEKFQRYKIISSQRATYFWFLIDFFWKLHPISREYNQIIDCLNNITRKVIANRSNIEAPGESDTTRENGDVETKPRRSMIEEMIASDMTAEEILVEANTVIAAGFESTSLTIHYMLFLLALNPEHQHSCREEIDELFNDPVMCQDGNLTVDALSEMKNLERCCLETLRIFPVIFVFQRKLEVSVQLDDQRELPAGTNVIIPPYTIHRNPKYFYEPDKFDPERFLPENTKNRHPYAFIPFSAGIRNCIGNKYALMEIKAVTSHILRHFSVSTVDEISHVPILPSVLMTPARDYKFILKRRSKFE